ncbi:MAG: PH domain-containing protein [Buchananella hordeovulneris]|nr:PH domain-containing protein [Buchananella hordeovulneris]
MNAADPFNPPGVVFHPVSSRLIPVRLAGTWITCSIAGGAFVAPAVLVSEWFYIGTGFFVFLALWITLLISRQVKAMGYAEAPEELLWRKGIMFKQLTAVPYGRMQYVDVSAGPIARAFGIAELKMHTAAMEGDIVINGLPLEEANRLRARLTALGEAKLAGL